MDFTVLKSALFIMVITLSGCASTDSKSTKSTSQITESNITKSTTALTSSTPKIETKKTYGTDGKVDYIISYQGDVIIKKKGFTYFEAGELKTEGSYVNDLKEGVETEYYRNGNILKTTEYKKGKKDGKSISYHLKGNVLADYNYKNDQYHGVLKLYNPSGSLDTVWVYENDTRKSELAYEYDDNNKLTWTRYFLNNVQSGLTKNYYPNGVTAYEYNFNNGEVESMISFDVNGIIVRDEKSVHGVQSGIQKTYKDGKLEFEFEMKNDKYHGFYNKYHSNGNIQYKKQYKNDQRVGTGYGYFITGELSWEAEYKEDQITSSKTYNKNGILTAKYSYKNKKKSGYSREFFELDEKGGGELSWDTLYKNGKKTKATQYYRAGNIASEIEFKDGKAVTGFKYTFDGKETKMTNAHFHNLGYEY